MDTKTASGTFLRLYPQLYLMFYRRRDPRESRPGPEALVFLEHLAASGPLTVSEAARHFDRSQAATSEIVIRLVERGLLARIPDERDRRRHLVWLTPEGRRILEEERQVLSPPLVTKAMERISKADRERLIRGMEALAETTARPKRRP